MLITIENVNKKYRGKTIITDYAAFLLSNGAEGFDILEPLSQDDFITLEINEINQTYINYYNKYCKDRLAILKSNIELFLTNHPDFLENKNEYYKKFKIPKKKPDENGNIRWRHLINPMPELKNLQKLICDTLQNCGLQPHNAAHAFRKDRDYYTNAEKHQNNKHIINLDLKDFFDSITEEILYNNLKMHPLFNIEMPDNYPILEKIIQICTLNGTTPQGSPASPFLSNMIMVNFDYRMRKELNQQEIKTTYTRYADDMSFSSKKSQDITNIIHLVEHILREYYHNTIKINYNKTKKITPGRCFITGVKLNQSHNLTVGWEKKKEIKSRIHKFNPLADNAKQEAQEILGYLSFMSRVEEGYTDYIFLKYATEIAAMKSLI